MPIDDGPDRVTSARTARPAPWIAGTVVGCGVSGSAAGRGPADPGVVTESAGLNSGSAAVSVLSNSSRVAAYSAADVSHVDVSPGVGSSVARTGRETRTD